MTYNPTNWKAGDTVTSAKLNKMEQGIANGGGMMVVHMSDEGVLDKTWQEIYDAMPNVIIYASHHENVKFSMTPLAVMPFGIQCMDPFAATSGTFATMTFVSDSPNSYPIVSNVEGTTPPTPSAV